jgi:hypothetical protein
MSYATEPVEIEKESPARIRLKVIDYTVDRDGVKSAALRLRRLTCSWQANQMENVQSREITTSMLLRVAFEYGQF